MDNKTIYALSTIYGKSGVAVIRVSGNEAFEVFNRLTDIAVSDVVDRKMYYTELKVHDSRETLDRVMLVGFHAPHSYSGENTVEINCHGSKAVIRGIIEELSLLPNFRLAEPGEFSRRAFYNGKIDLTAADGLADLIDAETSLQRKTALRQMSGTLFSLYEDWRERLVSVLSYIEAYIDFPDENIPQDTVFKIENNVFKIISEISEHIKANKVDERMRDGFNVVISGPANAGKSSLMNALMRRNVAIVSEIAGTTRDVLDAYADVGGFPVVFSDTAGLRDTDDAIEKIGVKLAKEKIGSADFNIFIFDADVDEPNIFAEYIKDNPHYILLANKADKIDEKRRQYLKDCGCILISVKNSDNLSAVSEKLVSHFNEIYSSSSDCLITRARYKEALNECLLNLKMFSLQKDIVLASEDIRLACRAIGKITGRVEVGEILDKIFSSFCIGK